MGTISENVRKATTFLLAVFLWLHALFFVNIQSPLIAKFTQLLRLTTAEFVLFALLVILSFLAASGFWKTLLSLTYIYCFPFVLLGYVFYCCFLILRAMNRWFKAQAIQQTGNVRIIEQNAPAIVPAPSASPDIQAEKKRGFAEFLRFLLRPFRRFTLLWCILLLVTTHVAVVWLCLIVVLAQLARKIFVILKTLLFSEPWLKKIGSASLTGLNTALATLAGVTHDAAPTSELRNLWNQLNLWRKALDFLNDPYLLSRWAWVLAIAFFGSIYVYVAVLFSFAYYGIARVNGAPFSWPDALVAAVFIPFFVSELPKIIGVKLLGGIHCVLVVAVGVGTIANFLRRKLDAIRRAARDYSDRFADQTIREKYIILEQKFSTTTNTAPPTDNFEK